MFRHVVCMKLKDFSTAPQIKEKLCALMGVVPEIKGCECAIDEARTQRSYDLIWIADFLSAGDCEKYLVHPAHKEVQAFVHTVRESSIAVDYSF